MILLNFPVSPAKIQELYRRMESIGIKEEDLEEKFIRSSGRGGQNVNKRATCVYLKHKPTGIEVKCQRERSQGLNRFFARRILVEKIEQLILGKQSEEAQRIAKIRRQKQKRSKRAKEKMLRDKKIQGEKKKLRSKHFEDLLLPIILSIFLIAPSCGKEPSDRLQIELHNDCSLDIKKGDGEKIVKNGFAAALIIEAGNQQEIIPQGECNINSSADAQDAVANLGEANTTEITWEDDNVRLRWFWSSYKNRAQITSRLRIENKSPTPLRVLRLTPLLADANMGGGLFIGKHPLNHRILENGSDIAFDFVARLRTADVERNPLVDILTIPLRGNSISNWNTAIFDPESGKSLIAGYLTFEKSIPTIGVTAGTESFTTLSADNALLFSGKVIQPGEGIWSEILYLDATSATPQQGLEDYADAIKEHLNIVTWTERGKRVPNGWNSWTGSSSTGGYGTDINQTIMQDNLKVMQNQFKNFGMDYFQMDDGYQTNEGDWDVNLSRFPDGLEGYVQMTRNAGLKPGIWIAPFNIDPWSNLASQHPDWIAGPANDPIAKILLGDATTLDLSNPDVLTHLENLSKKFAGYGMEWLKTDFAYLALGGALKYDPNLTAVEAYRQAYQAIRKGLGNEAFLLGVAIPLIHAGIADGIRITLDNAPKWEEKNPENLISPENSFKNVVRTASKRYFLHNRVFINHNDLLFFRSHSDPSVPRLSFEESRTFCAFIALTGSIVKLGDKLVDLKPEAIQTIRKLLPVYGPSARPLDLFLRQYPEVWSLHIDNGFYNGEMNYHIIGLLNWGRNQDFSVNPPSEMPDEARTYTIPLNEPGLDASKTYLAREFWTGNFLGEIKGVLEITVNDRDSAIIALREKKNIPQFLGHNRHWTQGATDLISENFEPSERTLKLKFHIDAAPSDGIPFEYTFDIYVPDGFFISNLNITGIQYNNLQAEQDGNIIRILFIPVESGEADITVSF